MIEDTQQAIAEGAAAGLAVLCGGYELLFEHKLPGAPKVGTIGRHAPGSRPPVSAHLLDLIERVERLAYGAEQLVCAWLRAEFMPYSLTGYSGDPNPLVTLSLGAAARDLPRAAPNAGPAVQELAAAVSRTVADVQLILGPSGGAQLFEELCPLCQSPALVRLHSPDRILCGMPGCEFTATKRTREIERV